MESVRGLLVSLTGRLRQLEPFVLLFSGGVDSTLLAAVAGRASLKFALLFADSPVIACRQKKKAYSIAHYLNMKLNIVRHHPLDDPLFKQNRPDRCYICRHYMCGSAKDWAHKLGYEKIVDGENPDDLNEFRPGIKAADEAGVVHPFVELGVTKKWIRRLARFLGLPNANDYPEACLASRFPMGVHIDEEALRRVEAAEDFLRSLGFEGCRVRCHGELARIELRKAADVRRINGCIRKDVVSKLRSLGFHFITVDLQGYRPAGSNYGGRWGEV